MNSIINELNDDSIISTEQFSRIAGVTEKRLRQLAAEGYFPAPKDGRWKALECAKGLIEFYRSAESKKSNGMRRDEELKLAAERKLAELKVAKAEGALLPA